jgi:leucyl aminopeptidase
VVALPAEDATSVAAVAEGAALGAYRYAGLRGSAAKPANAAVTAVTVRSPEAKGKAVKASAVRAAVLADAKAYAADLVNTPPNKLFPQSFTESVKQRAAAGSAKVSVKVLDEKALAKGGFGGIVGVGQGSVHPPRIVTLTWSPAKAKGSVALVGKGITFDSGGLNIKPAASMLTMKSDMAGAAAVAATVFAAAELGVPVQVTGYLCLAENLPSGTAQRPSDVVTMRNGTTVEILDTDAEGRLVLADAIVRACEDGPDYLLETSTLTGAQVVALGKRTMGVMGTPELRDRVAELARQVGEGGWAMPLPEHLREGLDSPLADLQNIAGDPGGGMMVAGHYLAEFVADGVSWSHLDIAGPSFNDGKPYGYTTSGGTGVPVRTLLAFLRQI